MKKIISVILLAVLLVASTACGGSTGEYDGATATAYQLLERMMLTAVEYESRDDAEYLEEGLVYRADSNVEGEFLSDGQKSYYYSTITDEADFSGVLDYALWTATASVSTEMGVFKAADDSAAETIEAFIAARIETLVANAKDYNAEEQHKAENALVARHGDFVVYIVTAINDELETALVDELKSSVPVQQ